MLLRILECVQKNDLIRAIQEFSTDDTIIVNNVQYAVSVRNGVPFYTAFVTYDTVYVTDRY